MEAELPLDKICLHAAHLAFYEGPDGLWTSEVRVTNTGPGAPERTEGAEGPPEEARGARLVSAPRQKPRG